MSQTRRFVQLTFSSLIILSFGFAATRPPLASAQSGDGIKRQVNAESGKVSFIGPESGQSVSASKALGITFLARPSDAAMALAKRFAPEFGLQNPERDLSIKHIKHPGDGRVTVRYQQNYQGIPVMGGELMVNTNENGDLYSMNGEVSTRLSLSIEPTIDSEQARQTALQAFAKWYKKTTTDFAASEPELWIFDESLLLPSSRPVELVWRMELTSVDKRLPVRELVLINAQRGHISLHFNQFDTAWQAHGNNSSSEQERLSNQSDTNVKVPENPTLLAFSPLVNTYTANSTSSLPGSFLCNQSQPNCTNGSDPHADAAHKYAIGTFNLYNVQYNRNSINNSGMIILSTVHYCDDSGPFPECPYGNAFWSGDQMVYGDAYGFPLGDDVVAHELTHGVTQYESNLFYYYQSGAINESFSDLWGEYYDQTNGEGTDTSGVKWQIGEDVSGYGAFRSMSSPTDFGDPDKMSSPNYYQWPDDNGGVHHNSGINSKAVFLMVDGGTFNGKTVTALGWVKTAAIYYEAQTNILISGSDYSDLYYALQQACSNLIGQKGITAGNCTEVKDAIDAVEMNAQPVPNFNTDAPLCDSGTAPVNSFLDDLETGTDNWTFTNGTHPRWQLDSAYYGPYAQSGLHSLYADNLPAEAADVSAQLVPIVLPSNAYLHFAHAYDFETDFFGYYDGGIVEYSTNGGSTWLDAGSLIEVNGYGGTIFTDWDNPLKGRLAFVGSSHGYISTRLNLASLAGQTVTFRWRMGQDTGDVLAGWGWWVDNVKIYRCPSTANISVNIGGTHMGNYVLPPSSSIRPSYTGVDSGPVKVVTTNGGPIVAALRDLWSGGGNPSSSIQLMGLPEGQLSDTYWFPAYNNVSLDDQIRFGNVGTSPTTVTVTIGGVLRGTYTNLQPNQSVRVNYPGLDSGPVKVQSSGGVKIIASIRDSWNDGTKWSSYSQLMGLPNHQLSDTYLFPAYNNVSLDDQIRFGNVGTAPTQITVTIGGVVRGTYPLNPSESLRVNYPDLDSGPVKVQSSGGVKIIASIRDAWFDGSKWTSYFQLMGLPQAQLSDTYVFPAYDNVSLDGQLRFGNVGTVATTVTVTINGIVRGTYSVGPSQSVRVNYAGLNSGPVKIQSSGGVKIIASLRDSWFDGTSWTSYSQLMGLPGGQLTTSYYFPAYNNVTLNEQLRIGVP